MTGKYIYGNGMDYIILGENTLYDSRHNRTYDFRTTPINGDLIIKKVDECE